jgi:hypothetical protein
MTRSDTRGATAALVLGLTLAGCGRSDSGDALFPLDAGRSWPTAP